MGTTVTAPASAKTTKDNSDIVSSTASDGRPGWQQAKDFLDSNWLTSMASYVLPGIGTARMVDDAVGNFKDGRTLAGLGDVALASLSVIPGIGQALGITSKAGRGLTGMMKGLRGGAKAEEIGAGGAKGLLREGSFFGNAAKESKEAKAALDAAKGDGSAYKAAREKLVQAQDKERQAQRAATREADRIAGIDTAAERQAFDAAEQARFTQQTDAAQKLYEKQAMDELVKNGRGLPANSTAAQEYERIVQNYPNEWRQAIADRDTALQPIKQRGLKKGGTGKTNSTYRDYNIEGISQQDLPTVRKEIDALIQAEEAMDKLSKLDRTIAPNAVSPVRQYAAPVIDPSFAANRVAAADEVEDAAAVLRRIYNEPVKGISSLEQAYKDLRSVEDWDSFAEILSSLLGASRTAAPWARGIIGQEISPLMYRNGSYSEQG